VLVKPTQKMIKSNVYCKLCETVDAIPALLEVQKSDILNQAHRAATRKHTMVGQKYFKGAKLY